MGKNSKKLSATDSSSHAFEKEMLQNDINYSIRFDRIQYDRKLKSHIIVEIIRLESCNLCNASSPANYDINLHYQNNPMKFQRLWDLCELIVAKLYIVVYSEGDSGFMDEVLLLEINSIDASKKEPIVAIPKRMDLAQFSDWLRNLNSRGK